MAAKNSLNIQVNNTIFKNVEQLYDSYAKDFFSLFHGQQNRDVNLIKAWLEKYDCKNPVLELGCGYGEYTKTLSSVGNVTSVDISGKMLSLAKKSNPSKTIRYTKSDMTEFLSKTNKHFNTIAIIYSLFHLPLGNIYNFLPIVANHVSKSGYLILAVQEGIGTYINKKGIPYTLLPYSDISTTLRKLNFSVLEMKRRAPIKYESPFFKLFLIAQKH